MNDPMVYDLTMVREYDHVDLQACEYLELAVWADDSLWSRPDPGRDPDTDLILLPCNMIPVSMDAACIDCLGHPGGEVVVPNRVKQLIDADGRGLSHLIVRPTLIQGPIRKAVRSPPGNKFFTLEQARKQPWWELESDMTLPPVSPTMYLLGNTKDDPQYRIQPGDKKTYVFRRENPYNHAEIHYRRSDVRSFPQFDATRTYEHWGPDQRGSLIVSQNFYQWWTSHGLHGPGVFVPVRIDEDL